MPYKQQQGKPRVILFSDGRHAAGLDCFEPPITKTDHGIIANEVSNSGIDAIVHFSAGEGGTVLYNSKVAQRWGAVTKKWDHYVWSRTAHALNQLINDGHDPLEVLCKSCHDKDLLFIASGWVSIHGGTRKQHEGLGRWSAFALDNPEFQVGFDPDPRANTVIETRFSFLYPEVRRERLLIFQEMLSKYETDGIELNLTSEIPYCRFDQVHQLAPLMTQWIRDLRQIAAKSEKLQGRRKQIYARIPAHSKAWKLAGYEIQTWVSENLVDGLFCESSFTEDDGIDQDVDLTDIVNITRKTNCSVFYSLHTNLYRQFHRSAPQAAIWAGAANAYDQGVDGIAIADHLWTPNGWPWTPQEYETVRLLGDPQLLATAKKHYLVRSEVQDVTGLTWLPGRSYQLPKVLLENESAEISFRVSDDLNYWNGLNRIKAVILRIRFGGIIINYDKVQVKLNRQLLPDFILKKVDMTYRLVDQASSSHSITPYGYAYDYYLNRNNYPKHGRNYLIVTLLKRDPNIAQKFSIDRVECRIEYQLHRHYKEEPLQY